MDWSALLQDPRWQKTPQEWERVTRGYNIQEALAAGVKVSLFRTHKTLSPTQGIDNPAIVYASLVPILSISGNRLNARRFFPSYPCEAPNFNFITVYAATPSQEVYPDESLVCGAGSVRLDSVRAFDRVEHFEANAYGTAPEATFMVLLPRLQSPLSTSIDTQAIRVLPLSPELTDFLKAQEKLPQQGIEGLGR